MFFVRCLQNMTSFYDVVKATTIKVEAFIGRMLVLVLALAFAYAYAGRMTF
jgi:hypothetical protein